MKNNLQFVFYAIALGSMLIGGCAQEKEQYQSRTNYQDLLFDEKQVTHMVTPETDTLYFGFHRQGADTLTDKADYLKSLFVIDRWSTAKFKRDFTVADSLMYPRGFWVTCNLTRYTGNFYLIVYPEKITQPCFIKLRFEGGAIGKNFSDSMTINLIPATI